MNTNSIVPIFFATDDGYAPALGVALASMLANTASDYDLRIHVLTLGLTEENREFLTRIVAGRATLLFVDMKEKIAPLADRLVLRDYYSSATYFRLFISELFPEYDKALYLDCDIILTGDIVALYETPLKDEYVAAIPEDVMALVDVFGRYVERVLDIPRAEYFNAGVLVMNLKKFREEDMLGQFLSLLSRRRFVVTQDQDYLNVLCRGAIRFLPAYWNTSPLVPEGGTPPLLIHYKLDRKPWHYGDVNFGRYFWQYAEATPFADGLRRELEGYDEARIERDRLCYENLVKLAKNEMRKEQRRKMRASLAALKLTAVLTVLKRCAGFL